MLSSMGVLRRALLPGLLSTVIQLALLLGCREHGSGAQPPDGSPGSSPALPEVPGCDRTERDGPDSQPRPYFCFAADSGDSLLRATWRYGEPTPPGAYRCNCNGIQRNEAEAASCEDALARACELDLDAPLACNTPFGACWPTPGDVGGWRCRCGEGMELVEQRAESCDVAAFATCGTPECSAAAGQCTRKIAGVGYDCACTSGERVEWSGVWDCPAALSTCEPTCGSSAASCALRPGGYACTCTEGAAGGAAGEQVTTLITDGESYGLCLRAAELACGPPLAGETCFEDQDEGIRCTADGSGGWDCDCLGRLTHVTNACPLPEGYDVGGWGYRGGLPGGFDPGRVPDDIETRLYSCDNALFECHCE